jgi:hypothetical protein
MLVFWVATPCSLAGRYRFGENTASIFRAKNLRSQKII